MIVWRRPCRLHDRDAALVRIPPSLQTASLGSDTPAYRWLNLPFPLYDDDNLGFLCPSRHLRLVHGGFMAAERVGDTHI